jgi:hypothetical protein
MKTRPALLVLLALLVTPLVAFAAPRQVVLLFTGDNGGEIAPCG